jgi:FMN phosphatase YigB (HAD superfamily)
MAVAGIIALIDVDNTLIDNDHIIGDLRQHLIKTLGARRHGRYWTIFEALRHELGYADYLGALQRYRIELPRDSHFHEISRFLIEYPFANRLFPGSLDAIAHLAAFAPPVILSDGDVVFQPRKIERSGLAEAVAGRVLIFVHKELELAEVERRYPAKHYLLVDDKVRILSAVKQTWGRRVTTIFPRQGHYAHDAALVAAHAAPDITIERIGELVSISRDELVEAGTSVIRRPVGKKR